MGRRGREGEKGPRADDSLGGWRAEEIRAQGPFLKAKDHLRRSRGAPPGKGDARLLPGVRKLGGQRSIPEL